MSKIGTAGRGKRLDKSILCKYCGSSRVLSKGVFKRKNTPDSRRYKCPDCDKGFVVPINKIGDLRVVVISDTHCGHITGLTPPEWQQVNNGIYSKFQKESWVWYTNMIERIKPVDIVICNGDMIDGRQDKSGGSELIIGDRYKQVEMARRCIDQMGAKKIYLVRGTPYHVGRLEQWEDILTERVGGSIRDRQKLSINGCIFDVRHKIGKSAVPHGRFTQIARRGMWEDLKTVGKSEMRANVIIASHVHYFIYAGHSNNRLMITTPALQGDTEYGTKECEGSVDYGFIKFDITENGIIKDWRAYIANFESDFNYIENVEL